ncbi:hypothetical protein KQX54_021460 [Cotesia glomerata]|uniref:TIL domain-containing protein n=1 Tax=Cotesia glomerata TaxID=32391 RepID=A0AAV7J8M7_COTGL|nr:hypothetical protein KQX54_021460 [Cotesia glomerata]
MTRALIYIFVVAFVICTTMAQECGENERYYSCGSCDTKCSDPGPMACTDDCRPGKCGCNAGYIRDDKSGKCIEPENCS